MPKKTIVIGAGVIGTGALSPYKKMGTMLS